MILRHLTHQVSVILRLGTILSQPVEARKKFASNPRNEKPIAKPLVGLGLYVNDEIGLLILNVNSFSYIYIIKLGRIFNYEYLTNFCFLFHITA